MTVTAQPVRKTRDITVAYLGELLFNAGFIDESQRAEVDTVDRQFRAHVRSSKLRADDEASPFKAIVAMNLTDASGSPASSTMFCTSPCSVSVLPASGPSARRAAPRATLMSCPYSL